MPPQSRNTRNTLAGLSVADTLSIGDTVHVTLGARLQNVDVTQKDRTTGMRNTQYSGSRAAPFAGLTLKPTARMSVFGNYSEGMDVGGVAPPEAVNAGAFLPIARTEQKEAGVKYASGPTLLSASVFEVRQQSAFTDPFSRVYALAGQQRNLGATLSVGSELRPGVRVLGGLMRLESELTDTEGGRYNGKTALGTPDWTLNLGGEWDVRPRVTLSGRVLHTGRQFVDPGNTQSVPDWTRLDLGVRTTVGAPSAPVTLRLNIGNALNTAYYLSYLNNLALGAPRTITVSATVGR